MKNEYIKTYMIYGVSILFIFSIVIPMVTGVEIYHQPKSFEYDNRTFINSSNNEKINKGSISMNVGPMDSPWPMKCHDLHHTGRSPYSTADNSGGEKWRFKTDGHIEGGAVIDDNGIIYFGAFDNFLYAVYPNGTLKWKYRTGGWIWSTPAISEDGTIYVSSYDDRLYAINPDGILKWKFDADASISSSPAIADDGTIYFGTMGAPNWGCRIYALDPNGTEKWHYNTDYKIASDPAIGNDGTVYIGSGDGYLYAMYPDGMLRWRFKTGDEIHSHPSIAADGTVYIGSNDDYLYALYPNGTMKWRFNTGSGTYASASIGMNDTIYVTNGDLYAVNPNGSLKWIFDFGSNRDVGHASPAIGGDGTIYVGVRIGSDSGGEIIAVNFDGNERWRKKIANEWVESSPCIDEDGTVYIGSSCRRYPEGTPYGYLHAFKRMEDNHPPDTPNITGPLSGEVGTRYQYIPYALDPDKNPLSYYVDWGDGTNSGWVPEIDPGWGIDLYHTWSEPGTYIIKAKARDDFGGESDWATLPVSMPKNKLITDSLLIHFLGRLIQRFQELELFQML